MCILQLQPCIATSKEAPLTMARKGLGRTVTGSLPRQSMKVKGPSVAPKLRRRCPLEGAFQALLCALPPAFVQPDLAKTKSLLSTPCNRQTSKTFVFSMTRERRGGKSRASQRVNLPQELAWGSSPTGGMRSWSLLSLPRVAIGAVSASASITGTERTASP